MDYLESRRWETQPLTADLIYRLLADALGDTPGLALYEDLGEAVLQICANPLLLTMVLTVYQATGKAPVGRGALYHQFVERFLGWGEERGLGVDEREALDALLPEHLTKACYQALAEEVLTTLAAAMIRSASRASWSSCAASCI